MKSLGRCYRKEQPIHHKSAGTTNKARIEGAIHAAEGRNNLGHQVRQSQPTLTFVPSHLRVYPYVERCALRPCSGDHDTSRMQYSGHNDITPPILLAWQRWRIARSCALLLLILVCSCRLLLGRSPPLSLGCFYLDFTGSCFPLFDISLLPPVTGSLFPFAAILLLPLSTESLLTPFPTSLLLPFTGLLFPLVTESLIPLVT